MENSLILRSATPGVLRFAPLPLAALLLPLAFMAATASCEQPSETPEVGGAENSREAAAETPPRVTVDWMPPTGEGLHRPADLALPPIFEAVLHGVVRVRPHVRLQVTLYADRQAAARARGRPDATRKTFRPEGGVLWPVHVDTASVTGLCRNPIAAVQPGLREVCEIDRADCASFPCVRVSEPLAGSGTGFAVDRGPDGRLIVATAYHVVREAAERAGRTHGTAIAGDTEGDDGAAVETLDLSVGFGGEWTRDVRLLAHASDEDWEEGRDWALLSIPADWADRVEVLVLAEEPPSPGDTLWTAGYPFVTRRASAPGVGYLDADDELRLSFGELLSREALAAGELRLPPAVEGRARPEEIEDSDLIVLVDAASGSSGSPVLDLAGRVVGILRDSTCKEGELDLRIARFCGVTLVVPTALFRDAVTAATRPETTRTARE